MLQVTIPFLWNDESPKAEAPLPNVPLSKLLLPNSIPLLTVHLSPSGAGGCVLQRDCTCSCKSKQHDLMQKMQTDDF